jgi:EAL domain-containing protein (putative c-di-GMP-specific phosphodiesterase class I)
MYLLSVIALLRWQHNDKFISPVEFIPVAEKSGRIVEIGAWVLHKACQDAVKWPFDSNPSVSLNVSSLQLLDTGFIDVISDVLSKSGLPPKRLHLEITESVMLENGTLARSQLQVIADMSIHVSIDDFGTGFPSLNQLQRMSFDIIKIDRSFLQNLNKKDLTIISATKLIADEFEVKTVAKALKQNQSWPCSKALEFDIFKDICWLDPCPMKSSATGLIPLDEK